MIKPTSWSAVSQQIYNNRRVPVSGLLREVGEIFEELAALKVRAAATEMQQVWYYCQLILHQRTGIDFTPVGVKAVLDDFLGRFEVWEEIFRSEGLEFHVDYLVGGSNYNRPHKVAAALARARKAQAN